MESVGVVLQPILGGRRACRPCKHSSDELDCDVHVGFNICMSTLSSGRNGGAVSTNDLKTQTKGVFGIDLKDGLDGLRRVRAMPK